MQTIDNADLYAAMVAVLAKLIDAEKRAKGTTRIGDYNAEALQLIARTKAALPHR